MEYEQPFAEGETWKACALETCHFPEMEAMLRSMYQSDSANTICHFPSMLAPAVPVVHSDDNPARSSLSMMSSTF